MLYLKQKLEIITAPKSILNPSFKTTKIQIINNYTNKEYLFDITDLKSKMTSYTFTLDSSSLEVGEHTGYLISENGEITERYLIQVGNYKCETKQYEPNIEIIQYNG